MKNKIVSVDEAIAIIRPGDTVASSGSNRCKRGEIGTASVIGSFYKRAVKWWAR